ncbi:MAG: dienelactone hydrolase family protein [Pleurocapsa sp. MO_226.B13]|nr:dienelactone hydrolase family protein [Pleurocapsa sp. MO_226.B13]
MQISKSNIGLTVDDSLMRVYVAAPEPEGQYPGILFYSDIYQLGRPITLLADRLAGYGYVVAAPEIYHRIEPIGTVIEPSDLGKMRGNDNARRSETDGFDRDAVAVLEWLKSDNRVIADKLGTMGFCIGGHLAFRAALQQEIKAGVCCYPTGIHNGKLGREKADTIERVGEITGEVLTIFGTLDPHVPPEGRQKILQALDDARIKHKSLIYKANHTFMRDDGYRYDPVATDAAWVEIIEFFNRIFA